MTDYDLVHSETSGAIVLQEHEVELNIQRNTEQEILTDFLKDFEIIVQNGYKLTKVYFACDEWDLLDSQFNLPGQDDARTAAIRAFLNEHIMPITTDIGMDILTPNNDGEFWIRWMDWGKGKVEYCDMTGYIEHCTRELVYDDSGLLTDEELAELKSWHSH
jgi:hypothetical protein